MKVLLTGGNGFIGSRISQALRAAGHVVTIVSRSNGSDMQNMLLPADWQPHLQGIDAVINAVGIIAETGKQKFETIHTLAPSALFKACEKQGLKRIVQISALGADDEAFASYQMTKKAADDTLRHSALDWFILRPSLVYGQGGASTAMFMQLANLPIIPLVGDGTELVQPVSVEDLVDTVLQCLVSEDTQQTIDIVGPEAMPFKEWLQRLREHMGKKRAKTLSFPFQMVMLNAQLMKYFVPVMHPDNLKMLRNGSVSDATPLTQFLGKALRVVP